MGESTVAIASIGLAGTTIAGLIWVVKYLAKTLSHDLREHTKAAVQQRQASYEAAQASIQLKDTVKRVGDQAQLAAENAAENLKFMKALNGKLAKATIQTVKEQHVEHQTVDSASIGNETVDHETVNSKSV